MVVFPTLPTGSYSAEAITAMVVISTVIAVLREHASRVLNLIVRYIACDDLSSPDLWVNRIIRRRDNILEPDIITVRTISVGNCTIHDTIAASIRSFLTIVFIIEHEVMILTRHVCSFLLVCSAVTCAAHG